MQADTHLGACRRVRRPRRRTGSHCSAERGPAGAPMWGAWRGTWRAVRKRLLPCRVRLSCAMQEGFVWLNEAKPTAAKPKWGYIAKEVRRPRTRAKPRAVASCSLVSPGLSRTLSPAELMPLHDGRTGGLAADAACRRIGSLARAVLAASGVTHGARAGGAVQVGATLEMTINTMATVAPGQGLGAMQALDQAGSAPATAARRNESKVSVELAYLQ